MQKSHSVAIGAVTKMHRVGNFVDAIIVKHNLLINSSDRSKKIDMYFTMGLWWPVRLIWGLLQSVR